MVKKFNTLIMVVNYKGAENYAADYFSSIINQDTKNFDLLILNDCVLSLKFNKMDINVSEIMISENMLPGIIRYEGLYYAKKNNYQYLIFSDIDDYFSSNRVSLSIKGLDKCGFVYNNLTLIDNDDKLNIKNYLDQLSLNKDINSFKQIIDYNFLGLSHTAINLKLLKNFYVPEGIIAVDWWIFTILILNGATGKYIDRAITYYRQYNDNFVGIKKTLNEDRLKTGIKVKKAHYTHVVEYCKNNHLQLALTEYTKKNEEIFELEIALRDKVFRKRYIEIINQLMGKIYQGWWSEIVDLTTWRKYAD